MATRVAWPVIVIFALSGTLLVFAVLNLGFNISTNKKQVPGLVIPPPLIGPSGSCVAGEERRQNAYYKRLIAAYSEYIQPVPCHVNNGDEIAYPTTHAGSFSKALDHESTGTPTQASYQSLINALNARTPQAFQAIIMGPGGDLKLTSPEAGLTYSLTGFDNFAYYVPPAPTLNSSWYAAELVEVYWQSLTRDINFDAFGTEPVTEAAIAEIAALHDYRGPKPVNASSLFRCNSTGCLTGPYLSQFFYLPASEGYNTIDQQINPYTPNVDFLTVWSDYFGVANGGPPPGTQTTITPKRYMINGRDIATYVHHDVLFQAYYNALLCLLTLNAPLKPQVPYQTLPSGRTEKGFATFGNAHLQAAVIEPAIYALRATWMQKWFVHRRLRPEEGGARVDRMKFGYATYPLNADLLNSQALVASFTKFGSYLLSQAYPEGCPSHPAYPAGHATVAGACVTILKFWFNETWLIPEPVKPSSDGSTLLPIVANLTVGGELNKLAYNVALGRDWAGVHYRSDGDQGLRLGQAMAVSFLRQQKPLYNEAVGPWTATGFDGELLVVS